MERLSQASDVDSAAAQFSRACLRFYLSPSSGTGDAGHPIHHYFGRVPSNKNGRALGQFTPESGKFFSWGSVGKYYVRICPGVSDRWSTEERSEVPPSQLSPVCRRWLG